MEHFGISCALLTAFHPDGSLDAEKTARHANTRLQRGLNSITLFGTTGEGASIGTRERTEALTAFSDQGIPEDKIILGVCGTAIPDVADQITQAYDRGITTFLLPPPTYFRQIDEDGLRAWHSSVLDATPTETRIILYHIPSVTDLPIGPGLIQGLHDAYPDRLAAIKDSTGSWDSTNALLDLGRLPVLVGDERQIHRAVAAGGAGSINGVSNLLPERLLRVFETRQEDPGLVRIVEDIVKLPVLPALKACLARETGDPSWTRLRPPLRPLTEEQQSLLPDLKEQVMAP